MSGYKVATDEAIVRDRKTFEWKYTPIKDTPVSKVMAENRNAEIGIIDIFKVKSTLNLFDYETILRNENRTVQQWLDSRGDAALKLTPGLPELKIKSAFYIPGTRYMGEFALAKPNTDPSHKPPVEDCTDFAFKYDNKNSKEFSKYILTTVNGYYLQNHLMGDYIYIQHGGEVMQRSQSTHFGLLNFQNISTVDTLPITKEMVLKVDDSLDYYHRVHINTGVSLTNKTVGIVIGGYLHLLDDLIRVISDNTIALTMGKLDVVKRVIASKDDLDLTFMGLDDLHQSVRVEDVIDSAKLLEYLTCKYSFIVLINTAELYAHNVMVSEVNIPGTVNTPNEEYTHLMLNELGGAIDYWYTLEHGIRCMQFEPRSQDRMLFTRNHWRKLLRINDARLGRFKSERLRVRLKGFSSRIK